MLMISLEKNLQDQRSREHRHDQVTERGEGKINKVSDVAREIQHVGRGIQSNMLS